jgi:hypothetical protein
MLAAKLSYSHLNYFEIFDILLQNGANPKFSCKGISILDELLVQADIILISKLFNALHEQKKKLIHKEFEDLSLKLLRLQDFYVEMKWDFENPLIPFSNRLLPSGKLF